MHFLFIFSLLISFNVYSGNTDSLLLHLNKETNPLVKVDILNELIKSLKNQNPDSAFVCAQQALLISKNENYLKGIGESYNNLGTLYFIKSNYDSSLVNYLQGLKYFKQIKDTSLISTSYLNIAMLYNKQDKYIESYKLNFAALKLQEKLGDKENLFQAYHNLASLLLKYNKNKKAKIFYEEAKNIAIEINRPDLITRCFNNLANIYFDEENFEMAMEYLSNSLKINLENNNKRSLAFTYGTIANVYKAKGEFENAFLNFQKSNEIFEEIGEKLYVAVGKYNMGNLFLTSKNIKNATKYIHEAREIALELNNIDILQQCERKLSQIYLEANDYKLAYYHQLIYDSLKENLIIERNQKVLEELQLKYETEKTEKELLTLREDNAQQALIYQEEKANKNYLYLGIVGLLIVGFETSRRYRISKRNNIKLEELIKERTADIEAKKVELELMLQEIHHRVKNNMQLVSSLVNLEMHYHPNILVTELAEKLSKKINCMAMIHNKLYRTNDLYELSAKDYFSDLFAELIRSFDSQNLRTEVLIEEHKLNVDKLVSCGLIINELVTNAYKHNFSELQEGTISLIFRKENERFKLIVRDNGKGIQEDLDKDNLKSLGLNLIYDLTEQIDGKVTFNNNNGLEVVLEF
jgi:two-component system, sensor histidine kinase PdtaS